MSSRESLKLFKLVLHQQTLKCLIAAENLFTCWIFVLFWISKPLNKYTCHFHSTKFHLSHENGALHVSKPIKSSECQKHYFLSASKAHRSNWKCFNAIENKDGEWKKNVENRRRFHINCSSIVENECSCYSREYV